MSWLACAATLVVAAGASSSQDWKSHWYDGQAELNGYRLVQPRYGQARKGRAVLVFVTERFSESARVKVDPGRHPPEDEFSVMKLVTVKDYQTGIYDYNLMTSTFVGLQAHGGRESGELAKLTFSAQEWCGATFEEWLAREDFIERRAFSYFDGEGDRVLQLPKPAGALTVDQLFVRVRGLPKPLLAPGQGMRRPVLVSAERSVLYHRPVAYHDTLIERSLETETVQVPAGSFEVDVYRLESDAFTFQIDVEHDFPHRIVRWQGPDGESAELLGSDRKKYWNLSAPGDEGQLEDLGLEAQPTP